MIKTAGLLPPKLIALVPVCSPILSLPSASDKPKLTPCSDIFIESVSGEA